MDDTIEAIGSKLNALKVIQDGLARDFRELKKARRQSEPNKKRKKKNGLESSFQPGYTISAELESFLGLAQGARATRESATKGVVSYIRKQSLSSGKVIKPDEKLLSIFVNPPPGEVTFFNLQTCIDHNFLKTKPKIPLSNELVTKGS